VILSSKRFVVFVLIFVLGFVFIVFVFVIVNGNQASVSDLHPTIDPTLDAHGYSLRRQRLQVNFYLTGSRFFHVGKMLELKCVAEIENFPELRRETTLGAELNPPYDINNQMLIHAGIATSKYYLS